MKAILKDKRFIALMILIALLVFLIYSSLIFINAFLGALIIFVIFTPLNNWLKSKKIKPSLAAWIIILLTFLIIIIPLFFLINGLAEQISLIPEVIKNFDNLLDNLSENLPFDMGINKDYLIQKIVPFLEKTITSFFSNILNIVTNLILFYFLLYYLLVNDKKFIENIKSILPFSRINKDKIIDEFSKITKASLIGALLIALIQGIMIWLGFFILGVSGALFWGFVTAILSLLPIVGSPIVWIPGAIYLFISGSILKAIILIAWGILITFVDNFVRPFTSQKYGKIHPLVTIIGVFLGVTQFGFIGILIGPLILSYFILLCKLYKEEYMDKD